MRDREHQQHRGKCAGSCASVDGEPGGESREHHGERADRGATGDPEHIGIGQRIAQQGLHQHAREREHDAGAESRERARQPQLEDDGVGQRVAGRQARPGRFEAGAAECERCGDCRECRAREQCNQQRGGHPGHRQAAPCVKPHYS